MRATSARSARRCSRSPSSPLRVGLTGGIGSGKSEVAKIFADLGAFVIDADELARDAVAPGSPGLRAIAERWPQTIASGGGLDRAALAAIVFADDAAREELNAIVHPLVRELALARERAADGRIVVREAPLLFEAGFYRECDANVLVVAPLDIRIARVERRSGLSRAEIERRIAAQIAPDAARLLADFTIDNDGDLEGLRLRTEPVYRELESRRPSRNSGRSPE